MNSSTFATGKRREEGEEEEGDEEEDEEGEEKGRGGAECARRSALSAKPASRGELRARPPKSRSTLSRQAGAAPKLRPDTCAPSLSSSTQSCVSSAPTRPRAALARAKLRKTGSTWRRCHWLRNCFLEKEMLASLSASSERAQSASTLLLAVAPSFISSRNRGQLRGALAVGQQLSADADQSCQSCGATADKPPKGHRKAASVAATVAASVAAAANNATNKAKAKQLANQWLALSARHRPSTLFAARPI